MTFQFLPQKSVIFIITIIIIIIINRLIFKEMTCLFLQIIRNIQNWTKFCENGA
jgi:hypothetical protein